MPVAIFGAPPVQIAGRSKNPTPAQGSKGDSDPHIMSFSSSGWTHAPNSPPSSGGNVVELAKAFAATLTGDQLRLFGVDLRKPAGGLRPHRRPVRMDRIFDAQRHRLFASASARRMARQKNGLWRSRLL